MNLKEIEERIQTLGAATGPDYLYDLLRCYGMPNATIVRLQKGSYNRSERDDECLWKGKVYFRFVDSGEDLRVNVCPSCSTSFAHMDSKSVFTPSVLVIAMGGGYPAHIK
jgi:hypothetical protein